MKILNRMPFILTGIPWMYIFTKWILPTSDLTTDTISGFNYYFQGHENWASMIWILMVCPLAGFCLMELLKWVDTIGNKVCI